MKKGILISILLLALSISVHGRPVLNGDGDFQFWNKNRFTKLFREKYEFGLELEDRYGKDASVLYVYYIQGNLYYNLADWLSAGPVFREQFILGADKIWRTTHMPMGDVFLRWEVGGWNLIDRNRVVYTIPEDGQNIWVYRNQVYLYSPWKFGKIQLNPLVYDEAFFREYSGYSENRLACGFAFTLSKYNKNELLFMFRDIKQGEVWFHQHVLYGIIRFNF